LNSGWGILELDKMNKSLLGKWCWYYLNPHYHMLCRDIIQSKLSKEVRGKSHFWKVVEVEMKLVNLGARVQLGDGAYVKFWTDV
jgi:hypothetical protein